MKNRNPAPFVVVRPAQAAASPQHPQPGIRRAEEATYQLNRAYGTTANVMRPGRIPRPIRMNWFIGPKPPAAATGLCRTENYLNLRRYKRRGVVSPRGPLPRRKPNVGNDE